MKGVKMLPMGAALLALGLGLVSVAPSPASARDENQGTKHQRMLVRVAQADDRDNERDSNDRDSNSGYLGVQAQRLTAALRRAKGIPESTEGTLVNNVEDQGPADKAGIKRGDVILQVNREATTNPADLVQTVRGLEPGKKVPVQIWRNGSTRTLTVTVGSVPEGSEMPGMPPMPNWSGPGDSHDMPPAPGMQMFRRNRDDLQSQIQDLREEVARLRNEVRDLRQEMGRRGRDHNDDGNRNDRDDNEGD
jgi:membrane-associated protease RseP (regulator of RpoE activity)